MKKTSFTMMRIFSLFFIVLFAVTSSCLKSKNPKDELEGDLYAVTFKIKDFETITKPLNSYQSVQKLASTSISALALAATAEETLFQWDFDLSTTEPVTAINTGAIIDYNGGKTDYSFVGGWPATGKAISFKGPQSVLIKLPVTSVTSLRTFTADVNSSGTGPRALFIDYSLDKGTNYKALGDTVRYPIDLNTKALSVERDLSAIVLENNTDLWIRISMFPGERGGNGSYNATTGTFKMDNVIVKGTVGENGNVGEGKVYYHIYNADTKELVRKGEMTSQRAFNVDLPQGKYYLSLLNKNSDKLLSVNNESDMQEFYISNSFVERDAEIYAVRDTFEVNKAIERPLKLDRVYSQILFKFTDTEDLSTVDSIRIKQKHHAFYYYPFATKSGSVLDNTVLLIKPAFSNANKTLSFNQFMGLLPVNKDIQYELEVFRGGALVRTFEVSGQIRNNIQVTFEGKLLQGSDDSQGFSIVKNENWDGSVTVDF